jgi:glycosyltransferase involved in cell wall biosynthesis
MQETFSFIRLTPLVRAGKIIPMQNHDAPYLSVIIPAYNEAKRIGATLSAIHAYLTAQPFTWEIIVVLDGPQDNTGEVAQAFADQGAIRCLDRGENRGKGFTVREGMLAARGEIRLFTDADNSTDISHFDQMLPLFANGADVVICSRNQRDAPGAQQAVPQPFVKRFLGNLGNLAIQATAVPGIWDTQCGFKAFRATAAVQIFTVAQIDRWGFDIEALALARHFGYAIQVVPAYWIDQEGTHVRLSDYFRTFKEAFEVRWNLLIGVYKKK